MIPKLFHQHSDHCSKTVDWFCTDHKLWYERNIQSPKGYQLLEEFGWIDNHFSYSFNSHGFRANEFRPNAPSVMFLGASIVLGTGVEYKDTWTYDISKRLGKLNYNLAISGGSNDSAFRIGNHYIPHLKPDLVVFVNAFNWRVDLITDEKVFTFYNIEHSTPERYKPFYKEWLRCPENGELNYLKNKYALYDICETHNIPIVEIDGYEIHLMSKHTCGRDIMHPGKEGHRIIADHVYEKINNV